MTTRVEEIDGKFVVTFNGELDTAAAAETEKALAPVMESLGKDIIFDCTDLEYIASHRPGVYCFQRASSAAGSPEKSTGGRFPCGLEKRERRG